MLSKYMKSSPISYAIRDNKQGDTTTYLLEHTKFRILTIPVVGNAVESLGLYCIVGISRLLFP